MTRQEHINEYNQWKSTFKGWSVDKSFIINHLITKFDYKTYLEIGTNKGDCFKLINIEHKDGVDPLPGEFTNYNMSSDDFFNQLSFDFKYDIIFIDGLHRDYQVDKDITNSLIHLSENGTIVCHDMNPLFEILAGEDFIVSTWNGDCWKSFAKLRASREDLEMFTVDTDYGVGIIRKGKQLLINIPDMLDYQFLNDNRQYVLNLISTDQFFKKF